MQPNISTPVDAEPARKARSGGLDLLRLIAMATVVAQHGLTATGHYDWTNLTSSGISIGQFGVAIFCAVSGWFAVGNGRDSPGRWLIARFTKLYPAYWLTTLFAFGIAIVMGRQVTFGLFLSQMAGTGFFTHGWDLVNVVSWFMSLLLLCYLLAAVARCTAHPAVMMIIFCAVAIALVALQIEISLSRHIIVFTAAAAARLSRREISLLLCGLLLSPLLILQPSFIYAVMALPALWLFQKLDGFESVFLGVVAAYTYEFFLLHGIFLAGAAKLIKSAPLAIIVGVVCTIPAAFLLRRAAQMLTSVGNSHRPFRRLQAAGR